MASNVEMIRPSSPTPHHLRDFKLSFLDQLAPPIYIPLIFFYQDDHLQRTQHQESLKASLANVLIHFYPLAGRFSKDNFSNINCNDSGAFFVESKVEKNLLEVIKDPTVEELEKYLPLGPNGGTGSMVEANTILLAVKINLFDCGGMAVAVQIHHNLADANTFANFMNAWAASSRGHEITLPRLDLANIFPPIDMSLSKNSFTQLTTEKIVTKRMVLDKKEIEKLKEEASKVVKDPTRVEAITLFLWRQFSNSSRAKGSKKLIGVGHAVNLRPRMEPPLPNHAFGNINRPVIVVPLSVNDPVGVLRDAIREMDGNFVKKIQDGDVEHLNSLNNLRGEFSKGDIELITFSSWSRFPVYDVDYGWGRPVWVSTTTIPFKNFMVLMSSSCGEGMEVWINMLEKDVASLDFLFGN